MKNILFAYISDKKILRFLVITILLGLTFALRAQEITFTTEIHEMVETDHFWKHKNFITHQYSAFSREGNNPDDVDFLYKDGKWHVFADCEGPGVVSRIWSTFRTDRGWGNMKLEIDGNIIYEGDTKGFFEMGTPFASPLSRIEVRDAEEGRIFGICYVPMPFKHRFRFMLDVINYNIIDVKKIESPGQVKTFNRNLNIKEKDAWNSAAEVLNDNKYFFSKLDKFHKEVKKFELMAEEFGEMNSNSPGITRGIIIKGDSLTFAGLNMKIYWDNEKNPSIDIPVELGFGSNNQNNLLLGRADGGKYIFIPMPFRKSRKIVFINNSAKVLKFEVLVYTEKVNFEDNNICYLRAKANKGEYILNKSIPEIPGAPLNEYFYQNGYVALEAKGKGHIICYMDYFDCQPELDEHIFIDEKNNFPDNIWNGTGHEDMFDMSWGHFNKSSFYISGGSQNAKEINVRLFWNAPISWKEEIKFIWEWTPNIYQNPNRDAKFSSVVYYYQ